MKDKVGAGDLHVYVSPERPREGEKGRTNSLLTNERWGHHLELTSKTDRKRLILQVPKGQK